VSCGCGRDNGRCGPRWSYRDKDDVLMQSNKKLRKQQQQLGFSRLFHTTTPLASDLVEDKQSTGLIPW
jgi:hypothetical protein